MKIGRGRGIPRAGVVLGSSGAVTAVDIEFGGVIPRAFYTRTYISVGPRKTRRGGYTLAKGEIEEDTHRRNRGHRKRGIIATSKVRAAITIVNNSPGDMPLRSCSWFPELSRLSNWDNMVRIVNSLMGDMTAQPKSLSNK